MTAESIRRVSVLLAVMAALGCGPGDGRIGISGAVTLDSEPVPKGSIAFIPVDGKGSTAGAQVLDGSYESRVAPGDLRVEIRVSRVIGERRAYDAPDAKVKKILGEALPDRYNNDSELFIEASPNSTRHDFALTLD